MNTNLPRTLVLCAALATLLLTGCVGLSTQQRQVKECHGPDDCRVVVSLVDCGAFTCHAKVDPDEIRLHGNNVFWELSKEASDSGFRFPRDGIFFKSFSGTSDFRCQVSEQGTQFHCNNNAGPPVGKEYKYGVQLSGSQSKSVWVLDPWIVN